MQRRNQRQRVASITRFGSIAAKFHDALLPQCIGTVISTAHVCVCECVWIMQSAGAGSAGWLPATSILDALSQQRIADLANWLWH